MKIVEISEATAPLAEYARQVHEEPILLMEDGVPVAILHALDDLDEQEFEREIESLSNNPKFLEIIERSRARQRAEGGISSEEMRRRLGVPPAPEGTD
jgi:PHD/YefM family antitoxin component YafN of YafNO toxin-antitoxin module